MRNAFGVVVVLASMTGTALAQQPCEQLKNLKVGTATITSAVLAPEGPFVPPAPGAAAKAGQPHRSCRPGARSMA